MAVWTEHGILLAIMGGLLAGSAFFACSEASLFYLRRQDRRAFAQGNAAQRIAARLLEDPDRLLSTVLFGNLLINTMYFALASIISLDLDRQEHHTEAGVFSVVALLVVIFFGEMAPKSVAVWRAQALAPLVSIPIAALVRLVSPIMPALQKVLRPSRRILFPAIKSESYLELDDLERAIQVSKADAHLLAQEQAALEAIVLLSDMQSEELMRPRVQFTSFRPPVRLDDLEGRLPSSGYLLVTESDSDEIAAAIPLKYLSDLPAEHLEFHATPVIIVPWCAPVASVLEDMRRQDRRVAAVVNELGETIGIITLEDVLGTIFAYGPARSHRLLRLPSIEPMGDDQWQTTGMTSLKRLARYFDKPFPDTYSLTVSGMLQESLQRFPIGGDRVVWGPFEWEVMESHGRGRLKVVIRPASKIEEEEPE